MGKFVDENGMIPSGLPIDIMRRCMENKELLTKDLPSGEIATYIGTGLKDNNGCTITESTLLSSGGYFISTKGSPTASGAIRRGGIDNYNFKKYSYPSILTRINPNAVEAGVIHYSRDNWYVNITMIIDHESPTDELYDIDINNHVYNDESLKQEAENYDLYSFSELRETTTYFFDQYGASPVVCRNAQDVYDTLLSLVINDPYHFPNLYTQVDSGKVYEFTVNHAQSAAESEQFSALKGVRGIMATNSSMRNKNIIKPSTSKFLLYVGLLRFSNLRFIEIKHSPDIVFSSEKTYFVFHYNGGNNKILYTEKQFEEARTRTMSIIYEMPKYNNDNLYFVQDEGEEFGTNNEEDSDYAFFDVYSDYDFIRAIENKIGTGFSRVEVGYFSSSFLDCSYTSLGYSDSRTIYSGNTSGAHYIQFDSVEGTEELGASSLISRKGYQRRYIVEGLNTASKRGTNIWCSVINFNAVKKIEEGAYPLEEHAAREVDLKGLSLENTHYMIVYKVINENPS